MSRIYTVSFAPTAVSASADFFELAPATNKPCVVHCCEIGQTTDYGDAQAEGLGVTIQRGGTAFVSGSGGSVPTPVSIDATSSAAGATTEVLNTTVATFTAGVTVYSTAFNVQSGWFYNPAPEDRITVTAANGALVVRVTTPADSITWAGTLVFEELG